MAGQVGMRDCCMRALFLGGIRGEDLVRVGSVVDDPEQ
jgi:hypothetical protein